MQNRRNKTRHWKAHVTPQRLIVNAIPASIFVDGEDRTVAISVPAGADSHRLGLAIVDALRAMASSDEDEGAFAGRLVLKVSIDRGHLRTIRRAA